MRLTPYGRREWLSCLLGFGSVTLLSLALFPAGWWIPAMAAVFPLVFFRDPDRKPPADADAFLSPADGTVADIGPVQELEFIQGEALRIGVFMSIFSVHVNRAPCAGTVEYVRHRPGGYRHAMSEQARISNESNLLGIVAAPRGVRVGVRQVVGSVARRIVCACKPGDTLEQGQRIGMIKFGSRLELLVPVTAAFTPAVKVGDKVKAGLTVLGRFEH
ncbi:MAG: phosphatidylserine decarboxylase [Planctomycetota bacterium]|nr:phosphatidylserine decarboxylase [Planctomycetota bacterium]